VLEGWIAAQQQSSEASTVEVPSTRPFRHQSLFHI
jgi:hypothetical protein